VFRILAHQMSWFVEKGRRHFVGRLVGLLEASYPDSIEGMTREETTAWVDAAVAKAAFYGIETEPEVTQLVLLFLVLDIDVDLNEPWAREILADPDLVPIGKVRALVEEARERGISSVDVVARSELLGEAVDA